MSLIFGKTLIIAPHLDDETIAIGGTIKRLTDLKLDIQIIIIGGHLPPLYINKKNYKITKKESIKALKILGSKKIYYLDLPAREYHKDHYQIMNEKIYEIIDIDCETVGSMAFGHQNTYYALLKDMSGENVFKTMIVNVDLLSERSEIYAVKVV